MVYLFGNWEACDVFLIHIDVPGCLFQCVWVPIPASEALQCEDSFAPQNYTFPRSGRECCILLYLSQKVRPAGLSICCHPGTVQKTDIAAVSSSCCSVAVHLYVRAGGSLLLGNAPFLGRSEEPT